VLYPVQCARVGAWDGMCCILYSVPEWVRVCVGRHVPESIHTCMWGLRWQEILKEYVHNTRVGLFFKACPLFLQIQLAYQNSIFMCKHVYHTVKRLSNFYEIWTEVTTLHTLASNGFKISSGSALYRLCHRSPMWIIAHHICTLLQTLPF